MTTASPNEQCALVIAARNEEAVIGETLQSALAAYPPQDIFVFCDGCTDRTAEIARTFLPSRNVIDRRRNIGKPRAIEYVLQRRVYPKGYGYVSILDADTTIEPDFREKAVARAGRSGVACAVGQVKSRRYPNIIATYRTYMYWVWQTIFKRIQNTMNAVNIAAGTATTWRTAALQQIDFDHRMSTEDFELTSQAHRKGLGRVLYTPDAVVHTQDPFSFRAYCRQNYRWSRAWWETVRKHRIGLQWLRIRRAGRSLFSGVDIFMALFLLSSLAFFAHLTALLVFLVYPVDIDGLPTGSREAVLTDMALQVGLLWLSILLVGLILRRPRILLMSPVLLGLVFIEFAISMTALASTVRRQYRVPEGGSASIWTSPERQPFDPEEEDEEVEERQRESDITAA